MNPICLPQTPGFDIVGHICACGSKVGLNFKEGDRVAALVRTGGNARFISVPVGSLIKVPKNLDSAEAVALVSTFTTAYQTLKRLTQKGPMFSMLGKRVLILGGMDGVGQALIQMCSKARAEIYAPSPHSCHSFMSNVLGAHPLPEDKDQWLPLVEGQMDYVFDGVCEDGLDSSDKALNEDGELVCFGHMAMLKERHIGLLGAPLSAHVSSGALILPRFALPPRLVLTIFPHRSTSYGVKRRRVRRRLIFGKVSILIQSHTRCVFRPTLCDGLPYRMMTDSNIRPSP